MPKTQSDRSDKQCQSHFQFMYNQKIRYKLSPGETRLTYICHFQWFKHMTTGGMDSLQVKISKIFTVFIQMDLRGILVLYKLVWWTKPQLSGFMSRFSIYPIHNLLWPPRSWNTMCKILVMRTLEPGISVQLTDTSTITILRCLQRYTFSTWKHHLHSKENEQTRWSTVSSCLTRSFDRA
jgi:hypothetical protein